MSGNQAASGVQVAGLDVERGGRSVIAGLSFDVARGEALLLTGPNGAGKTTLIRALAGLVPVKSGTIELGGLEADGRRSEQCHYVAHANAAKLDLTVAENLQFWTRFSGGNDGAEDAAMREAGLWALADLPVRYLSAGQQRRVAIARLLVASRPLWLLDEPTVSLDQASTDRLVDLGNRHLAARGMIIAATHVALGFQPARELRLEAAALTDADGAAGGHRGIL